MFAAPPTGAHGGGDLEADLEAGVLFASRDYGGAWQGDIDNPDAPDARERIRQAQEFGLKSHRICRQAQPAARAVTSRLIARRQNARILQ